MDRDDAAGVLVEVFPTAYYTDSTPPKIAEFDGTAPDCTGVQDRDLGYCTASDTTVYLDQTDLATARLATRSVTSPWTIGAVTALTLWLYATRRACRPTTARPPGRPGLRRTGWDAGPAVQ